MTPRPALSDHFRPPTPPRPAQPLPKLELLRRARRNLLEMFSDKLLNQDYSDSQVLFQRVIICNSPETVQAALVGQHAAVERKSPQMRHALEPLLGDGLFISDGPVWAQRRRMVAPVVHVNRLHLFAPVMVEVAQEAAARWAALPAATPVAMLEEMARLTAEIICRTVFGRALGRDQAREIVDGFSDYQRRIGQTDLLSLLGLPDWLPRLLSPGAKRSARRIQAVIEGIIEAHRKARAAGEVEDEPTILRLLMEAEDPDTDTHFTAEALRNEAAVLFMAGHETTANSLAWTWYLLSQSPRVAAKLHEELDRVLGGRPPTLADMSALPYARAVFEESLRLYPPVPILPREATEDCEILGRPVPKGAIVLIIPWLLHRKPSLWDMPDHFIPERFLAENAAGRSKYAYVPFSAGPRVCLGLAFGMTEAVLCLATLAQQFAPRLAPGAEVRPVCRLTLRPEGGLPMLLDRR
jgi:cytochrome P450